MDRSEILSNLCSRDSRNPLFDDIYGWDDIKPVPREDCACDNCFYGRDKLATALLSIQDAVTRDLISTYRSHVIQIIERDDKACFIIRDQNGVQEFASGLYTNDDDGFGSMNADARDRIDIFEGPLEE